LLLIKQLLTLCGLKLIASTRKLSLESAEVSEKQRFVCVGGRCHAQAQPGECTAAI
jgi:hypothetical protein